MSPKEHQPIVSKGTIKRLKNWLVSGVRTGAVVAPVLGGSFLAFSKFLPSAYSSIAADLVALSPAKLFKIRELSTYFTGFALFHPFLGGGLLGFLLVFTSKFMRTASAKVFDYGWPQLDTTVLFPFRPLRAYDPLWGPGLGPGFDQPAMDWVAPSAGTRRYEAWKKLEQFANGPALGDGRNPPWAPPAGDFVPFSWVPVVGRAGSGKSRLIVHYLTQSLAQGKMLAQLSTVARKKFSLVCWTRRVLPWVKRHPSDPWDVGWLCAEFSEKIYHHNRRVLTLLYKDKLPTWTPRRPTAILLDDPLPSDAEEVIEILFRRAERGEYNYPVRLFVVCQTLPEKLAPSEEHPLCPGNEPIELSDDCGFSPTEVEAIITAMMPRESHYASRPGEMRDAANRLYDITEGNPMLVELGVHILQSGRPLQYLDAQGLVRARAQRIVEGLGPLGCSSDEALRNLASAAIAGPGRITSFEKAVEKGWDKDLPKKVRACFSLARDRLGVVGIPAVRPLRVADAFVRLVLEECCAQHETVADEVVRVAWWLNPEGVIGTIRRASAQTDQLGRILRNAPPENVAFKMPALAEAYIHAASRTEPGDRWPTDNGTDVLEVSRKWISKLEPQDAENLSVALLKAFKSEIEEATVRQWARASCYFAAIASSLSSLAYAGDLEAIEALSISISYVLDTVDPIWRLPYSDDLVSLFRRMANRLDELAPFPEEIRWQFQGTRIRRFICLALAQAGQPEECRKIAAEMVESIASPFKDQREFALERVRAWQHVCFASSEVTGQAEECRKTAAELVESIASPFKDQREFALERVRAWRHVCFALCNIEGQADECRKMVSEIIESIARPFEDQREFALERVKSWHFVCFALCKVEGQANECRRTATEKVDSIASLFEGEREFALDRVKAWRHVCYALSEVTGGAEHCRETAREVDAMGRPFEGQRDFALERIVAWRYVCYALSKLKGQAEECRETAREVDAIGRPFEGQREFALERIKAWRHVCSALSEVTGEAEHCYETARDVVDSIGCPFESQRDFALERVEAWRYVCYAMSKVKGQSEMCRKTAIEMVDSISDPFKGESKFALERVEAWRHVCYALAEADDRRGSREAAEWIDAISLPFPAEKYPKIYIERDKAWSYINR